MILQEKSSTLNKLNSQQLMVTVDVIFLALAQTQHD